jgi:effector-binding domain-containing protein
MIETPRVITTTAQKTAFIPITATWDEIQEVMGPGLGEVQSALADQGIAPVGPWFAHHKRRPIESFDFEICVPVAAHVWPVGRVKSKDIPALNVVTTVYHGGYENLGKAWGEFHGWLEKSGLSIAEDFYECYVVGPESGPDSSQYRTQFSIPLKN